MDTRHQTDRPAATLIAQELDREIAEVEAAIALVRSGAAVVVSLANMRYGEEVLRQVRARGADRGVRLEPRPWPEDAGCDIDVRRIDE
jgi:electron transfer flavoprotein alpha/beta subunit